MNPLFEGLGLEAISFQREGLFFKELTLAFSAYLVAADEKDMAAAIASIEKITFARSRIQIKLRINEDLPYFNGYVYPPAITQEHPLVKAGYRRAMQSWERYSVEKIMNGTVDLEKGTVGGEFSEIIIPLFMDGPYRKSKLLSGEQMAAKYLHELGHVMGYFEFLGRTATSNVAMADAARTFSDTVDKKLRIQVLEDIETGTGVKFDDKAALAASETPETVVAVVAAKTMAKPRSSQGTPHYDQGLFEAASDLYVSRQGAGRALVTTIDTIARNQPAHMRTTEYQSSELLLLSNMWHLGRLFFKLSFFGKGASLLKPTFNVGLSNFAPNLLENLMLDITFKLVFGRNKDLYTNASSRYDAIRRDLIASLKENNLPAPYVRGVLEDLIDIEEAIGNLQKGGVVTNLLAQFVLDTLTGRAQQIKFQQQFEKLANNELFVKAAQFNTLSSEA